MTIIVDCLGHTELSLRTCSSTGGSMRRLPPSGEPRCGSPRRSNGISVLHARPCLPGVGTGSCTRRSAWEQDLALVHASVLKAFDLSKTRSKSALGSSWTEESSFSRYMGSAPTAQPGPSWPSSSQSLEGHGSALVGCLWLSHQSEQANYSRRAAYIPDVWGKSSPMRFNSFISCAGAR